MSGRYRRWAPLPLVAVGVVAVQWLGWQGLVLALMDVEELR